MFILKIMNVNNCLNDETMTAVNAMNGQKDDNEYNEELDTSGIDINRTAIQSERKDQM